MTHSFPRTITIRITILVLFLSAIAGVKFYVSDEMTRTLSDIRAHYTQGAAIRDARDTQITLLSSFTAIKGNESAIRAALPAADYIVPFRDAVEDAVTRVSAKVTATYGNPEATELTLPPRTDGAPREQIYKIATSITVEGDARALQQFLKEIEALPYYFTITNMKSTSAELGGWESSARTIITGTLYAIHNQ